VHVVKYVCSASCTLHRCLERQCAICEQVLSTPVYVFANTLSAGHAHALAYAQFVSLSLGNKGGEVELVYVEHLFAGVEGYFDMRRIGVLSVFSLFFDGGWRVCGCMCVDAHTHTLTASGYSGCELKCRDGAFREHEEIQMD